MTAGGDRMDQKKIGNFIAILRKEHTLTQKELANKIGVSDKTISKWENGRGLPEVSIMHTLCETLDISINELLSGERLDVSSYREKAEENITALMQRGNYKQMILHICISTIPFLLSFVTLPLAAEKIITPISIPIILFWSILWIVGNFVAGITYGIMKKWNKRRILLISIYNVFLLFILINLFTITTIVFSTI